MLSLEYQFCLLNITVLFINDSFISVFYLYFRFIYDLSIADFYSLSALDGFGKHIMCCILMIMMA